MAGACLNRCTYLARVAFEPAILPVLSSSDVAIDDDILDGVAAAATIAFVLLLSRSRIAMR